MSIRDHDILPHSTAHVPATFKHRIWGPSLALALALSLAGAGEASGPAASAPERLGAGKAGQADSVFSTRGTIARLAASGNLVAALTTKLKGAPDRIVVWSAPGARFARFDTHVNSAHPEAVFEYVSDLALGAGHVAWVEGSGGNSEDLVLYTAPALGGGSKALDEASNHDGAEMSIAGGYIGELHGAGPLLAYNGYTLCSLEDTNGVPTPGCAAEGSVSGQTLSLISAGARVPLKSGPGSFRLRAVGGGRMALEATSKWAGKWVGSGVVTVLSRRGTLVATIPAAAGDPPRKIALTATGLVVERGSTLDVYDPAGGAPVRTIPLRTAAPLTLVGAGSRLALLMGVHRLVVVRLVDGKQVAFPLAAAAPVDAELDDAGLFYAYNVPKATAKGRIVFEPTARLLARF
jgi:hypothetical protein